MKGDADDKTSLAVVAVATVPLRLEAEDDHPASYGRFFTGEICRWRSIFLLAHDYTTS
jgi:hypothetical protein